MTEEQAAQIVQGIADLNTSVVQLHSDLNTLQIILAILCGMVLGGFLMQMLYDLWRH